MVRGQLLAVAVIFRAAARLERVWQNGACMLHCTMSASRMRYCRACVMAVLFLLAQSELFDCRLGFAYRQ